MKSILIDNDQLFPVELKIADMREYFSIIMNAFEEKDNRLKNIEPQDSNQFDSWLSARMTYAVYFKISFRYSFVVQLYSLIEFELKSVCKYIETQKSVGKSMDKVKCNSMIEKAEQYLKDHIGLDLESIQGYSAIKSLRRIRNVITHSNGFLSEKDPNYSHIDFFSQERPDLLTLRKDSDQIFLIDLEDKFIQDFFLNELERFLIGISEFVQSAGINEKKSPKHNQ